MPHAAWLKTRTLTPKQWFGGSERGQSLLGSSSSGAADGASVALGRCRAFQSFCTKAHSLSGHKTRSSENFEAKALQRFKALSGTDVRWRPGARRMPGFSSNKKWCQSRRARTNAATSNNGPSESTSGRESEPFDVELEFEKWERGELAAILAKDKEFSVTLDRSDPWASGPSADSTISGENRTPGELSSEAASVLGATRAKASFPIAHSAHAAEAAGADELIKVEVPSQDAKVTGIEVLRLLAELDKGKQLEKARAKQSWWRGAIYEAGSLLLFVLGWLRTTTTAAFQFLLKQPGELFNLSWPTPTETLSTMGLVTGTIAVLLVLISTMDTGFTYVLASLVRRSAQ